MASAEGLFTKCLEEGEFLGRSLTIYRHHNGDHTHPFLPPTPGNDVEIVVPPPEDLLSTDPEENYLEVRLTATDTHGLSKTVTQRLNPKTVGVRFETQPTAIKLGVNGTTFAAPRRFVSWEGYKLNVNAPYPQTLAGTTYVFASWSDGGAQGHDIVTGAELSTYTASYTACTITGSSGDDVLNGTSAEDVIYGLGSNDTIKGLDGNDILKGDSGTDKLYGRKGDDTLEAARI